MIWWVEGFGRQKPIIWEGFGLSVPGCGELTRPPTIAALDQGTGTFDEV